MAKNKPISADRLVGDFAGVRHAVTSLSCPISQHARSTRIGAKETIFVHSTPDCGLTVGNSPEISIFTQIRCFFMRAAKRRYQQDKTRIDCLSRNWAQCMVRSLVLIQMTTFVLLIVLDGFSCFHSDTTMSVLWRWRVCNMGKSEEDNMAHLVDVHVGKRIRQRRWLVGMTQQKLAECVGIKFQQIQNTRQGQTA